MIKSLLEWKCQSSRAKITRFKEVQEKHERGES